jgi:hypothetical protein
LWMRGVACTELRAMTKPSIIDYKDSERALKHLRLSGSRS